MQRLVAPVLRPGTALPVLALGVLRAASAASEGLADGTAMTATLAGASEPEGSQAGKGVAKGSSESEFNEVIIVFFAAAFMLLFVIGNFLHRKHISMLPESVVAVGLGAIIGWAFRLIDSVHFTDNIVAEGHVNETILMYFLLPIIIFESGWALKRQDFFSQLGYILLFAVVGTLISTLVVGGLTLATADFHGLSSPRVAFAFAALISAVDPVATLATYSHLAVDPLLNMLVFGESVVNDAVAIALFRVLNDPTDHGPMFGEAAAAGSVGWKIAKGMVALLFGSIFLGLALGAVYILVLRFGRMSDSPSQEILFIFVSCFFTFSFAEGVCGMSGIITVLFCAIFMRCYATAHLTYEGRILTSFLLKQVASISDSMVFFFVGIALVYASSHGVRLGCWMMLFCLLGRAAAIFPLANLANCMKAIVGRRLPAEQRHYVTWKHMIMMFHSGLRGGIALVLALELGGWVDELGGEGTRRMLRNASLVVICAFLVIFGGTTEVALQGLGIPMGIEVQAGGSLTQKHAKSESDDGESSRPTSETEPRRGCVWRCLVAFHEKLLLPVLVGEKTKNVHMSGGVVSAVLAHAAGDEASAAAVPTNASAGAHVHMEREDIYDLFGTEDPADLAVSAEELPTRARSAPAHASPAQTGGTARRAGSGGSGGSGTGFFGHAGPGSRSSSASAPREEKQVVAEV